MKPWERYQAPPTAGPWTSYQGAQAELSAGPSAAMPPINRSREAPGGRIVAGLKSTPEGVARSLESQYGPGNVMTDKDGAFYVKDKGEWVPFDKEGFTMGDIADWSGAAVASLPALAGAATGPAGIGAALVRGAIGGAAGSLAQQGAGAITPGGDPMTLQERGVQGGVDAALGGAGGIAGKAASRLLSVPRNAIAKQTGRADTPVARESKDVESFLGESLTPGQTSQRQSLLYLEGALRRSPTPAADIMQAKDTAQLLAARKKWDETLDMIHRAPQSAELLGNRAAQAFDDTLKAATDKLDNQARIDFSILDEAAGKRPMFALRETVAAVDGLLAQYDVPGAAADASKSLVRQLHSIRDALATDEGLTAKSAAEMQRLLSSWGRAAGGSQKPFLDIADREQRGIGKQVFAALNRDLDTAAVPDPSVAQALRTARDNYRTNFQGIDELRKSAIGQYLGMREAGTISPEGVAQRIAGMQPSQLKATMKILGTADPELAQASKRLFLEQAMTASEPGVERIAEAVGQGMKPEAYSPARVLANLAKSPALELLDKNERFAVHMLSGSMQRLANRGGTEGSPTAALSWARDIAGNLVKAGLTGDITAAIRLVSTYVAPKKLAEAIADPKQTRALMTLAGPNPPREATLEAASILGLMGAARDTQEDVRPFGGAR